jgi:hypothetical protein
MNMNRLESPESHTVEDVMFPDTRELPSTRPLSLGLSSQGVNIYGFRGRPWSPDAGFIFLDMYQNIFSLATFLSFYETILTTVSKQVALFIVSVFSRSCSGSTQKTRP